MCVYLTLKGIPMVKYLNRNLHFTCCEETLALNSKLNNDWPPSGKTTSYC